MSTALRLLYIEDDPADFALLERLLNKQGWALYCQRIASKQELSLALQDPWDIALVDYKVPGMPFAETVHTLRQHRPNMPVILVSGTITEAAALTILQLGVDDFVLKDSPLRLANTIQKALDMAQERSQRQDVEQHLAALQDISRENQRLARLAALNLLEDALSARQQTEAARAELQRSEAQYRLLAENSADCIFWSDQQQKTQYLSPACVTVFGITQEEGLANPNWLQDRLHPADRLLFEQHVQNVQGENRHHLAEIDFRIHLPNGEERWINHTCQPILDEAGQYLGRCGSNRDITHRKQAEATRDLFSAALRQSPLATVLSSPERRITYVNPAFTELFGYTPEDIVGQPIGCLKPIEAALNEVSPDEITQHLLQVGHWHGEGVRAHQDGSPRPVMISIGSILDQQQQLVGFVGSYVDLRALRQKEEMLNKLSLAVEQSPESIEITDLHSNIEYVNDAFVRISGYSREELIGQNPRLLKSSLTPPATFASLWAALSQGKAWQGDFFNLNKQGELYVEHAYISPIREPNGKISHYVAVKEDITLKRQTEEKIHRLAYYDPLTGLPNRTLLLERLASYLGQAPVGALLSFNLDRFKTVNDAAGPVTGDRLLQALGERLNHLPNSQANLVARISGDEFCLLLTDLDADRAQAIFTALAVARDIQHNLNQPFSLSGEQFKLSACIGISLFPEPLDTPLDVLRRANTALHYAKQQGSNQTAVFDAHLDELNKRRFAVEYELRQGIPKGQLRLFLQSQVRADGTLAAAETLVRWQHPQHGLIQPGAFIPIAEESDLIVDIGNWMMQATCNLLSLPLLRSIGLRLAVNISPRQFRQSDFIEQVQQALSRSGAPASQLTLEITEGMVLDDVDSMVERMRQLSALGIHFAMDDFGTGYSSLSYLKRLPIDELKIDKSFVQDVTTDPNDAALVEVILSVARHMGLNVVAEGVETQEQADFLNQHGTVIHQGYLYARPVPVEEWLAGLGDHAAKP